jgi:hypothetical protein
MTSETSQTCSWFNQVPRPPTTTRLPFAAGASGSSRGPTAAASPPHLGEAKGDLVADWLQDQVLDRPTAAPCPVEGTAERAQSRGDQAPEHRSPVKVLINSNAAMSRLGEGRGGSGPRRRHFQAVFGEYE